MLNIKFFWENVTYIGSGLVYYPGPIIWDYDFDMTLILLQWSSL